MKKRHLIPAIFLLTALLGCGERKASSTEDILTIDVTARYPEKELSLQDCMEVEYVALETTDEFITQGVLEDAGKDILLVTNRFAQDGNIFIYNRNGKGLRRINRLGQGGEEYTSITKIILDEEKEEMFVIDYPVRKIRVYDLYGNFKRSFPFADTSYYNHTFNYDTDNLIGYKSYLPLVEDEQSGHVLISKQDGSIIREIPIPFQEIKTPVAVKGEVSVTPGFYLTIPYRKEWVLTRPSADTIYRYEPEDTIRPLIVRTPSIYTMDTEVFLFPIVMTDRYYFLQKLTKELDFETMKGYPLLDLVYDRQENSLFEYSLYNDDFVNKKQMSFRTEPVNHEVIAYRSLDANELIEANAKGLLKGQLKEIAATLNEESNPVLMLVKSKE